MPSKRRSSTSNSPKQLESPPRFLLDRNLGSLKLRAQLSADGLDVIVHDEIFDNPAERDPWIFYQCGKKGMVLVTSDKTFLKFFPHMAAIRLGKTAIFYFTQNNYNSAARGRAMLNAKDRILKIIRVERRPFIASISMGGQVTLVDRTPEPNRKQCDPQDWASYKRVCKEEGISPDGPSAAGSAG